MKKLTTPAGVFGPFASIETLADRYRADGVDLPISVVGIGMVSEVEPGDFPEPEPPGPSQFARDEARYRKRAAVKDELLSYMAADNMSRVRAQEWTVADLTGLVADPAVKAAMDFMGTLSFELAAQSIATASTPLLTPAIRADWIARLQAHFYLEG